jgi:hypothetical protein
MANEFFDLLKSLYSKEQVDFDPGKHSIWQVLLFVSHDKDYFTEVEKINRYMFIINPKYIIKYLKHTLPYVKSKFLRYTKKDVLNHNEDNITTLMNEYGISRHEALLLLVHA